MLPPSVSHQAAAAKVRLPQPLPPRRPLPPEGRLLLPIFPLSPPLLLPKSLSSSALTPCLPLILPPATHLPKASSVFLPPEHIWERVFLSMFVFVRTRS